MGKKGGKHKGKHPRMISSGSTAKQLPASAIEQSKYSKTFDRLHELCDAIKSGNFGAKDEKDLEAELKKHDFYSKKVCSDIIAEGRITKEKNIREYNEQHKSMAQEEIKEFYGEIPQAAINQIKEFDLQIHQEQNFLKKRMFINQFKIFAEKWSMYSKIYFKRLNEAEAEIVGGLEDIYNLNGMEGLIADLEKDCQRIMGTVGRDYWEIIKFSSIRGYTYSDDKLGGDYKVFENLSILSKSLKMAANHISKVDAITGAYENKDKFVDKIESRRKIVIEGLTKVLEKYKGDKTAINELSKTIVRFDNNALFLMGCITEEMVKKYVGDSNDKGPEYDDEMGAC